MNKISFVGFLLMFFVIKVNAQQSFLYFDSLTYRLYNQNKWDNCHFSRQKGY